MVGFDGKLLSQFFASIVNGVTNNVVASIGTGTISFLDTSSFMGFIKTLLGGWLGLLLGNSITGYIDMV
jgi:hypothetical protein